jgi:hypothetical protein
MEEKFPKEKEETPALSDAGAVVEQTKGEIRGRWVDSPPTPFISTRT